MKKKYIYTLVDPITHEVRYVGQASNPKTRLSEHTTFSAGNLWVKNKKNDWVNALLSQGLKPVMNVICICDATSSNYFEAFFGEVYKDFDLVNTKPFRKHIFPKLAS